MDPLSITVSAVALAANVLRSAAYIKDAADEYRNGPSVVCDIEGEVKIVQAALLQVEAALQRDAQSLCRLRLRNVFELSVEGCRDTLQQIDNDFEALFGRRDWRARLAVWWNAGEIRRLLATLDTKKGSLTLLVQALSLHSVQELQDLLQQNMRTLDAARLGLDDMVHSYPAYASKELDTVASAIGSEDSVLGDRDSVVSSTRFAFDDICFTSKPYRQTVARVLGKKASKKTSGKASVSVPVPPDLPSVKEAEAVTASEPRDRTANPVPPTGVSAEEYEAVVAKLREAEALIQQLQERMRQSAPFKAKETEQPATLPAGERVPLAEDAGEEAPEPAAKSDGKGPSIPKVSYTVPDDEASTTIISGNTKVSRPSQKSLLIEYFEGGKPQGTENSGTLKPSVRVRVTPSGIKHTQNGQHTSSSTVRRKRRYPKRERRTPSPVPEDEDQPLHEPAAANTVSESAISSIPPSSFLDGPEPPSTVRQSRDPAEPAGVRPVPGALCEEAKKPLRMTARELREKALGDDLHSEIRHQEKQLARKERSHYRSGHRSPSKGGELVRAERLSTGGLTLYDAVEEEERWREWPSRAVKVPREKERRNGKQRREEGIEELEELYERIERLENQWLEDERLLKEQREIRERLRNNRVSPKSQPLPTAPSPRADDDPALRPSIETIKETVRALEQVDELAREAERLDALYSHKAPQAR